MRILTPYFTFENQTISGGFLYMLEVLVINKNEIKVKL